MRATRAPALAANTAVRPPLYAAGQSEIGHFGPPGNIISLAGPFAGMKSGPSAPDAQQTHEIEGIANGKAVLVVIEVDVDADAGLEKAPDACRPFPQFRAGKVAIASRSAVHANIGEIRGHNFLFRRHGLSHGKT